MLCFFVVVDFVEVLPLVEKAIATADFVAIDTELSGLFDESTKESPIDDVQDRYTKLRSSCEQDSFIIIQMGLCTFHWDTDSSK